MVRELVSISVGSTGIRLGSKIWSNYCNEHNININVGNNSPDGSFECVFDELSNGKFKARSLLCDSESILLQDTANGSIGHIFNSQFLLNLNYDSCNNFFASRSNVSDKMIDEITNGLRLLSEKCNNTQGFVVNRAVYGGTGSYLGSKILDILQNYYGKKLSILNDINDNNNNNGGDDRSCVNKLLCIKNEIDNYNSSCSFMYSNDFNVASDRICIINKSMRFDDKILSCPYDEYCRNLIPIHQFKYLHTSFDTLKNSLNTSKYEYEQLFNNCLQPNLFDLKFSNNNHRCVYVYMCVCVCGILIVLNFCYCSIDRLIHELYLLQYHLPIITMESVLNVLIYHIWVKNYHFIRINGF